jgi:hypothetical protein
MISLRVVSIKVFPDTEIGAGIDIYIANKSTVEHFSNFFDGMIRKTNHDRTIPE